MRNTILLLCLVCTITQAYAWKPQFAGHRGSYRGVENTEEAMMNGINHYGYTGLEIDVRASRAERASLLPLEMNACLPGGVWNATPRSLSPLERNIGFWTQA